MLIPQPHRMVLLPTQLHTRPTNITSTRGVRGPPSEPGQPREEAHLLGEGVCLPGSQLVLVEGVPTEGGHQGNVLNQEVNTADLSTHNIITGIISNMKYNAT